MRELTLQLDMLTRVVLRYISLGSLNRQKYTWILRNVISDGGKPIISKFFFYNGRDDLKTHIACNEYETFVTRDISKDLFKAIDFFSNFVPVNG